MIPKIILHIGTHKTGTTSIQRWLALRYQKLMDAGILFPKAGRNKPYSGQHELAWSVMGMNNVDDLPWKSLLAEIQASGKNKIVISAEAFSVCNENQIKQIRDYFFEFDVKVVLYLRNQFDFMVSNYKETIKSGNYGFAFQDYLKAHAHRCDYSSLIADWLHIFGEGNVLIRIFDKVKISPGLIPDFLDSASIAGQFNFENRDYRINISPSDQAIAFIRLLNGWKLRAKWGFVRFLLDVCRKLVLNRNFLGNVLVNVFAPVSKYKIFNESDKDWLRQSVQKWNSALFAEFISQEDQIYFEF